MAEGEGELGNAYMRGLPGGTIASLGLVLGTAYDVYYLVVGSAFFVSNTVVRRRGPWAPGITLLKRKLRLGYR
jgi:hypothetical protein